jgi:outer membrane receptor for ferric coprogen and ferric-rhodotorulic acid
VDAYEVGAKFEFANRRVRLNLSGFHMEMSNFQVLEFTGIQFVTFNVPNVLATGFEAEGFAQITDNFSVSAALTYSNARYPGDCNNNLPAPAQVANLCGADLTNAPDLVGIFGATFDGPITASGWNLMANANVRMESQRRTSTQPSEVGAAFTAPLPFDIQEDNVKVNLRLGLTTPDERFTFEIWGTNIFDVVTRNVTFNVPLRGTTNVRARAAFIQEPARYGITARARF